VRDSITSRHKRLLAAIEGLPPAWRGDTSRIDQSPEVKPGDFGAFVKLGPALGKGMRGEVSYPLRHKDYLLDIAHHDDSMVIEFDSGLVDFGELTIFAWPLLGATGFVATVVLSYRVFGGKPNSSIYGPGSNPDDHR